MTTIYAQAEKVIYDFYSKTLGKRAYITRFADTKDANRGRVSNWVTIAKKPSDFMITFDGDTFYAEVKSTQKSYIDSGLFKTQRSERLKILSAGGSYIYFVYSILNECWYVLPGDIADRGKLEFKYLEEYRSPIIPKI